MQNEPFDHAAEIRKGKEWIASDGGQLKDSLDDARKIALARVAEK